MQYLLFLLCSYFFSVNDCYHRSSRFWSLLYMYELFTGKQMALQRGS